MQSTLLHLCCVWQLRGRILTMTFSFMVFCLWCTSCQSAASTGEVLSQPSPRGIWDPGDRGMREVTIRMVTSPGPFYPSGEQLVIPFVRFARLLWPCFRGIRRACANFCKIGRGTETSPPSLLFLWLLTANQATYKERAKRIIIFCNLIQFCARARAECREAAF